MRAVDIIIKKRDKQELTKEEINTFIQGFTNGEIPDYQAAAWAMAVVINGMNNRETADLTLAMANSGDVIDLTNIVPIAVDKHSTGGVGDKTTLVVEPVVAACGIAVGKMSGRCLGFSGGTLDKMESIPGFRTDLSQEEFTQQLKKIGLVLTGQTGDLAPADGKLYALRDVTGTVQSIPLIASSIMSKKFAGGAQGVVLDVKMGLGAFMQTLQEARDLANVMVEIGKRSGRKVTAVISDMNQPLGNAVGNALELQEAIDTLKNRGPKDFFEHCIVVASHMLLLGEKADTADRARQLVRQVIEDGSAWKKFGRLIEAQGGDVSYIQNPEKLPSAGIIHTVNSPISGWIAGIHAREVGETAVELGAGRAKKGDAIDHSVGIVFHHKVGEEVEKNAPIFTVHANNHDKLENAVNRLNNAIKWSDRETSGLPLFYDVIH